MRAIRSSCVLFVATVALVAGTQSSVARETDHRPAPTLGTPRSSPVSLDQDLGEHRLRAAATAPETTVLGAWTFDGGVLCDEQGWTSVDITAQPAMFFHVDDFVGLDGGDFGHLYALEGNQSMWCGARPDTNSYYFCQYATLPGYGNNWQQRFETVDCVSVTGDVSWDFIASWDSEPGYDATCVQFDHCDDNWIGFDLGVAYYGNCNLDGWGLDRFFLTIADTSHSGSLRLRFEFVSDVAWSDEDGFWNTDGAFIVDSLTVSDTTGIVLPTELFEGEAVGDQTTLSGNWEASVPPGYGDFAALYKRIDVQEDPCYTNLTCVWAFIKGSTENYSCGGHPEQPAVPHENERGQYLLNEVWSPWVPIVGTGETFEIAFDVYDDLPKENLVGYKWAVRFVADGCATLWRDDNAAFFQSGAADWQAFTKDVTALVEPGATMMQMSMGAIDLCPMYCGQLGAGACHSHAPLFDNAVIRRIESNGPRWSVSEWSLFQDNFPGDGTPTGTVRADMALDVLPFDNPNIRPGDSVVVTVFDPENGLAADLHTGFGSAVYAYVGVWPQGQSGKGGDALTENSGRWPVVDSLTYNGSTWYCVRMDTAFFDSVYRTQPRSDGFCVDLNDNLFTPGDRVCYVFSATSDVTGEVTYYSSMTGTTDDIDYALSNPMEFTCLPVAGGTRILYVDAFDGMGAQPFFDTAFDILGIADQVDRYDVLASNLWASNGPASRVTNVVAQLVSRYHTIIWNTGSIDDQPIGDGFPGGEKQDDYALLYDFLNALTSPGGVYLSGDNLATGWGTGSGATALSGRFINFNLLSSNHADYGLGVSPLVIGVPGGCFSHGGALDSLIAYTNCPVNGILDVLLQASFNSSAEAKYYNGATSAAAVLSQEMYNDASTPVRVMLSGFSYHDIRDIDANGIPARAEHLDDILTWIGGSSPSPTPAGGPTYANSLGQNYPNPFNPTTTVEFTVKKRARVQVRVYNVSGQLVTTLVDDERVPGIVHRVEWDGRNAAGQSVASGVYFYKLATTDYTKTRKMVLLK